MDTTANVCPTHGTAYPKLERCPDCRSAATNKIQVGSPKADTSRARTRAAEYRLNQAACWEGFTTHKLEDPHVAVKFSAEAGKWAGRADELEMRILEIEHHQWMMEQDKLRRGGN